MRVRGAGMVLAVLSAACRHDEVEAPRFVLEVEEPPAAQGELLLTAYAGEGGARSALHRTTWIAGQAGYRGMEDNDLRGHLDGSFKYGWNQVGQNHVRIGRREKSPTWGEHEIFRVVQRWDGITLPPGALVAEASLELGIETGPKRPIRLYLYEVHRDWNPGAGGVLGDNVSPPRPGEVWWNDAGFQGRPWGHPGAGLASNTDPEADTPVTPLAEALYTPGGSTLTFRSPELAAYATRRVAASLPLLFLLKVSDPLEDVSTGTVTVYSSDQGDSRNLSRRPRLTLTWSAPGETATRTVPLLLEHGRTLELPPLPAAGARAIAVTFRPSGEGCPPTIEWRPAAGGEWTRASIGSGGPWDAIAIRAIAACEPLALGTPFTAEFHNTWVLTAPPEEQHVPWVFRSPDGRERVVPARYAGNDRWTVSFEPDEPGRWTYRWSETFTEQPYTSATGTFDVLVDPAALDTLLVRFAADAKAWDREEDPGRREVLATRFARLERAAVAALSGREFLQDGGAALRRRLNVARAAFDEPVPDVIPLVPNKPRDWKRKG